MTPSEYVLLVDGVGSGVMATAGYGMLTFGVTKFRAIRACFWSAAIGIGILGIVWGADVNQPLWARLIVAGCTAAVAAMALTWALWSVSDHAEIAAITATGPGGPGGNAEVMGQRSGAVGGAGGMGGLGPGGRGGNAEVKGDDSYARGGDGGNAGQPDGRGGRRTLSPGERENLPTAMWPFGYGGRGANKPEYDRRLQLLMHIRQEYMKAFPDDLIFIEAGIDTVPTGWINKRLEEMDEQWRVTLKDGGYVLPPLPSQ